MKIIIAGSRSIKNKNPVHFAIENSQFNIDDVITGGANGVDTAAEDWANSNGIQTETYEPKYEKFDEGNKKFAPLERNERMAREGDALIAVWDGKSTGTINMIQNAADEGIPIEVNVSIGGFVVLRYKIKPPEKTTLSEFS